MNINVFDIVIRIVTLELEGRLDAFTAPQLRSKLDELQNQSVIRYVLDLTNLEFMDSAGMAVMVTLLKHARQQEGDVKMVLPKLEAARRILRLTRFDRVFDTFETAEEARKSFSI
ncbi:STAS domain-containing protein [Candidatus Chlorohelix sp.]|uniref:STAS domain-containing protein n=1 Tax=Candidatus Chlorohelix sp. TaxID=3139201 RepID=UPI0030632B28